MSSMKELIVLKFVEKKSRFYGHLYEIGSQDEIMDIIKIHRRNYKKANHHCWAIRVQEDVGFFEKGKNDGEVGNPGAILLELLKKSDLDSHALVVSRIFGGIKLGVGGVSRSFRKVGSELLIHWKQTSENPK